jgi:hypothetical protein
LAPTPNSGKRADKVEANLNEQGAQIQVLNDVTQAAQAGARTAMATQVAETTAISNEIVEGTTELRKKVMPVFQARGRVADQLDRINTMNPLERGIRGIFDLNYDRDYSGGSARSLRSDSQGTLRRLRLPEQAARNGAPRSRSSIRQQHRNVRPVAEASI